MPKLTDEHWQILDFLRQRFATDNIVPTVYETCEANHIELESFCIEHEDPALVLQVLHHLGLQGRRNTSYPQGLKAALNLPTQH